MKKFTGLRSKPYTSMIHDSTYSDDWILKEKVSEELAWDSYDDGEVNGTVEDYSEMMI